jgi:hypothetical protein
MGKLVPGGSESVSSPGMSPSSQTERASARAEPAPWTKIQTATFKAMIVPVIMARRWVSFSSR